MKHSRNKLVIEIIATIIALVIGGTVIAEVSDDDDDDCGYSCQVESDDFEDDD